VKTFTERERRAKGRRRTAPGRQSEGAGSLAELQSAVGNRALARLLAAPSATPMLQRWFGFRLPTPAQQSSTKSTATCSLEGGTKFAKKATFAIESFHWSQVPSRKTEESESTPRTGDFSVVKRMDAVSPDLFQAAAQGHKIDKVEVVIAKGSTKIVYEFRNVYVSAVRPGGGGGEAPLEEVSFSFESVTYGSAYAE
jgi:type VI protein secretion system component Hcp